MDIYSCEVSRYWGNIMLDRWFARMRRQGRSVEAGWEGCESRIYLSGATFPQQAIVAPEETVAAVEHASRKPEALTSFADLNGSWFVLNFGNLDLEVFGNINHLKIRGSATSGGQTFQKVKGEIFQGSAVISVSGRQTIFSTLSGKARYDFVLTLTDPTHFHGDFARYFQGHLLQTVSGTTGTKI